MKGFLMGALTLIVIEVLGRNAPKAGGGLKVIAAGIRRTLAPNVAGLRDFSKPAASTGTGQVRSSQVNKLLTTAPARVR